jgi:single-stranded-DNA-specific exonuclease
MTILQDLKTRAANNQVSIAQDNEISFRGRRWIYPTLDTEVGRSLLTLGLSRPMAAVLTARSFTKETAPAFLETSIEMTLPPEGYIKDLDKAVERIVQAISFREHMAIWGDYDVDGATSSAIMARTIRAGGGTVEIKIPDRITEGYGPNIPGLLELKKNGVSLVIIVDSGTTAFDQLQAAADAGLECVVIDHHTAKEELPVAVAVVNPNRKDQEPGYGQMCAAGLAWLVCRKAAEALGLGYRFADELLDIAALGTVCDVVPLTGINRAIVKRGLELMQEPNNNGIAALIQYSGVEGEVAPYHLGFMLGPRINAGGRIGESWMGAKLLSSDDRDECMRLAERLTELNTERQQIEKACLEQAMHQAETQGNRSAIVIYGEGWHEGVIGIVAGRIKEAYDKPVFVFSKIEGDDETNVLAKGSGRSMPDFDMGTTVIKAHQDGVLAKGGGHAMAAGATIAVDKIEAFHEALEKAVHASKFFETGPTTRIDCLLHPAHADVPFVESLQLMEPFGQGNPKPRFLMRSVQLTNINDKMAAKGHFKAKIRRNGAEIDGLMFKAKGTALGDALFNAVGKPLDVVVTLDINEWNGRCSVQAMIEDARPAKTA